MTAVYLRILGRRIGLIWTELPDWAQDGFIAWAIAVPLWLLLIAVLLVF